MNQILRGIVTRIKPLNIKGRLDDVLFMDSKTNQFIDLSKIIDEATLVGLQLTEEDPNIRKGIRSILQIFFKRLDEKYVGRCVDIILKSPDENGYFDQKIESADDSDMIRIPYKCAEAISDIYFGS